MSQYTPGALSVAMKGAKLAVCRVAIGATGAVGAIEQGKGNVIASVTRVSAGLYRFQLGPSYPDRELVIIPMVASQTAAGSNRKAFYDNGTYSSSAGTFDIQVTDLNNAGPAAADPVNGDSLHVVMYFARYKN